MGRYDTQQVCLNGHQITDNYHGHPEFRKDFCDKCGERTIHVCPNCDSEIRGEYHAGGITVLGFSTPVPEFCHVCGKPYPWTEKKQEVEESIADRDSKEHLRILEHILTRFHAVSRQIRSRYNNRPTLHVKDEYDVQDLLHALLRLYFEDIRKEEWTPSYAGGSSRMDFLLKNESIVVEVKRAREDLGVKEIGDQLIIDIDRYKEHPSCRTLICFVYDPEGNISNPQGLENDLGREENGLVVRVIVSPKAF